MSFFDSAFNLITKGADFIFGDKSETVSKVLEFGTDVGKKLFDGDGGGQASSAFINQNLAGALAKVKVGTSSTGGNLRQYVRPSQVTVAQYVQASPSYASLIAGINQAVGNVGTSKMPLSVAKVSQTSRSRAPRSLSSIG